jgi:hypothetical protein
VWVKTGPTPDLPFCAQRREVAGLTQWPPPGVSGACAHAPRPGPRPRAPLRRRIYSIVLALTLKRCSRLGLSCVDGGPWSYPQALETGLRVVAYLPRHIRMVNQVVLRRLGLNNIFRLSASSTRQPELFIKGQRVDLDTGS